jgi:hypothetical protein
MLSEVFWVAFITTASGMIIKLASMAYKSKCSECSFCCIKVIRNVDLEEKETEFMITNKPSTITNTEETKDEEK